MSEPRGGDLFLGIDVGTGSARAGLFDAHGAMHGSATCPIEMWRPETDFVEQSSADIWQACGRAVREAMSGAGAGPAGTSATVLEAMTAMNGAGEIIEPAGGAAAAFHQAKHEVFLRLRDDQVAYRETMNRTPASGAVVP